jgi:integrase
MSNHLELRANLWYATLTIPKDVREILGKMKFIKSLETSSRREALIQSAPLIALWRTQIDEARGNTGAVASEASRWKGYLAKATGVELDVLEEQLLDKAKAMVKDSGENKAGDFYQVAMGYKTPLNSQYDKWLSQISLVPKTKDQTVKDVNVFLDRFTTIEQVTKQNAKKWIEEILQAGHSVGTANRLLISSRNYWTYLRQQDVVEVDNEPLTLKGLLPSVKKKNKKGYIPFEPENVVKLWREAKKRGDQSLADLIYLGAYTGARIEEICSMRLENISDKAIKITASKTNAGIREVPIHSELFSTIKKLKDSSEDGYLLSGLTFNKYGDRSNNLGKRFGKLKTELGFAPKLEVFHSIRKTLVTLLENAGVPEGIAADIVGHEKPNITYKLYSGGNVLDIKKEAIEKAKYPFK